MTKMPLYAHRMTKYVGKISLWNSHRFLIKTQTKSQGIHFCRPRPIHHGRLCA